MVSQTEEKLSSLAIDRSANRGGALRPAIWMMGIAVCGGAGGFALWTYLDSAPLEVRVSVARAPEIAASAKAVLDGNGYVVARRQATVSSKTSGVVVSVYIEEGMQVEEGQLLAQLDDTFQAARKNLVASQISELEASLEEIDIQLQEATTNLTRLSALAEDNFASEEILQAAQFGQSRLEARRGRVRKSLEVLQNQLAIQDQLLEDMKIRAPFSGVVIAKAAQPGETISPVSGGGEFTRTGICTIVDMDSLEVEVDVSEAYINRVVPGQQATVEPTAFPNTRLPARVIAIIPTADRAKETVRVRVGFTKNDERMLPDMGVQVSFLEAGAIAELVTVPEGVTIPSSALDASGSQPRVWVVSDGVVDERLVEVAESDEVLARVSDGLRVGETVVVDLASLPSESLRDGREVAVL